MSGLYAKGSSPGWVAGILLVLSVVLWVSVLGGVAVPLGELLGAGGR